MPATWQLAERFYVWVLMRVNYHHTRLLFWGSLRVSVALEVALPCSWDMMACALYCLLYGVTFA